MILVNFKDIKLGFGGNPIFEKINLQIHKGQKIALIGRNGSGKTTLLKLLNRENVPDAGEISFSQGIKISKLNQVVPEGTDEKLFSFVLSGVKDIGELLKKYDEINRKLSKVGTGALLKELDRLTHLIDINKGWEIERSVKNILGRFKLDNDVKFSDLSAGKKRIALLTKALISKPDLLLLDEPTNHLDINMILWLEEFIRDYNGTIIFVTHDRALIEKTATCIVELDRGLLTMWDCTYKDYLQRKNDSLIVEEKARKQFLKKLSNEEVWIRQGIKARRTRNEGRVKKLILMREEKQNIRTASKNSSFSIQNTDNSGKTVLKARKISFKYDASQIINDFSVTVSRGDRIGIIGENGCGKTTLLNLLLRKLEPDSGRLESGTNLQVHYFDQLKGILDDSKTIVENVCDGNDILTINGKPKHVIGYLQDFLFSPEKSRSKVSVLSGGERTRVLLAKLFTLPSNLLIMDEPTNDLDIETMELLEEILIDYPGTLLIVSHDRTFLNNVVTSVLAFKENGEIEEFIGGYSDFKKDVNKADSPIKTEKKKKNTGNDSIKKLSYKEQNELDKLPGNIEKFEEKKEKILNNMAEPDYFKQPSKKIMDMKEELDHLDSELIIMYKKWEELESRVIEYEEYKKKEAIGNRQ